MNIRKIAIWGGGFLAFVVLFRIIGAQPDQRPVPPAQTPIETPAAPEPRQREVPPARPVEQAMVVGLKGLLGSYADNEIRADSLYKGKLVEVSGLVGDVKKDILGSIYVTLGTGRAFEIPTVQCYFDDENANSVASLSKGDKVTVRGRVSGLMMNVLVKDCTLVSVGP